MDLNPNPELLRLGVYCSFVQQGFARFESSPEPNLRVFNIVNSDAPIIKACTSGSLENVRSLFSSQQASPYDRLWGDRSLLDLVFLQIISVVSGQTRGSLVSQRKVSGLKAIFEELVKCGLDPGLPRTNKNDTYGPSPLAALAILASSASAYSLELVNLGRTIIKNSIHDPILGAHIEYLSWDVQVAKIQTPFYTLLQTKEDWPIAWRSTDELRDLYLTRIREGSEHCIDRTMCYDSDPHFRDYILSDVLDVDAKLSCFSRLCLWGPGGILEARLAQILMSYLGSRLGLRNLPLTFHDLLREFRQKRKLALMRSILSAIGLAYQLSRLVEPPHYNRPQQLKYASTPDAEIWSKFIAGREVPGPREGQAPSYPMLCDEQIEVVDAEWGRCDSEEGFESSWESGSDMGDEQDASVSDSDSSHDSNAEMRGSSVVGGHKRKWDESMSESFSNVEFGQLAKTMQHIRTDDIADDAQRERDSDTTLTLNSSPSPDIQINATPITNYADSDLANSDDEMIDGITIELNLFWT